MASWTLDEALSTQIGIDEGVASKLVRLIDKDQCTLPFIARYRKQETGNIALDKLRQVFETLDRLKEVQKKIESTLTKIEKTEPLPDDVKDAIKKCHTVDDLDFIAAPFKSGTGTKKTLAARAAALGLDSHARDILAGKRVNLNALTVAGPEGEPLDPKTLYEGIQHSLADIIFKDGEVFSAIKQRFDHSHVKLVSSKRKETKSKQAAGGEQDKCTDAYKYEKFFDYSVPIKYLKNHQVLAINRAESLKVITVKVVPPAELKDVFVRLCDARWRGLDPGHRKLVQDAVADSYSRLVLPCLTRQCRASLKKEAEQSSVDTFGENLRCLLLQPPCPNEVILGIDPGFTNGCKMAVISKTGEVLDTATVYLHVTGGNKKREVDKLVALVTTHGCSVVALGNGTACRETEAVLSDCIERGLFRPCDIKYTIVNEDGSSVYSVSTVADSELPGLDQNLKSAVSIARRLQDPLSELVKIEPQHLGVGMYQHDMPESKLKGRLRLIVSECVSFVGVDVNTASLHVLSHISGLNAAKAKAIVTEKKRIGSFICREQLLNVKGLGAKSYEQCAGFITVRQTPDDHGNVTSASVKTTPKGARGAKKAKLMFHANPLDQTMIHPQSYNVAHKLLELVNVDVCQVGTPPAVTKVKQWMAGGNLDDVSGALATDRGTLDQILEALQQTLCYDLRETFSRPLFQSNKRQLSSLAAGDQLMGAVRNVTEFGAFVDIGVKCNGLIHVSKMAGRQLSVGNQVKVKVLNVDYSRERIALQLLQIV